MSHGSYWTNSTYGRSGCWPDATSASPAAISSSVPPRWIVAARRGAVGRPGDRPVERPVDLEHAGAVAEPLGAAAGAAREPVPGDGQELAWREVEQHGTRRWQIGDVAPRDVRSRPRRRPPRAPRRAPAPVRRPRHGSSASRSRGRRSRGPARTRHSTGDRGGASSGPRSRRTAPCAGSSAKPCAGEALGRAQRREPEPGESQRMTRQVGDRPQELASELVRVADQRPEQAPPGPAVLGAQPVRRWR